MSLYKGLPKEKVSIYLNYIKSLKSDPKTNWSLNVQETEFEQVFRKVADIGMYIDGDSITLAFLKKVVVNYDYHAYKNKVLINYPETIFDFGIVYEDDVYSFSKESGKVIYKHEIKNPFSTTKKIVGAYGIVKNSKGEFIELLDMATIDKMKKTSKMTFIWDAWFDRMVLKSVIKRICSVHFKDLVKDIEDEDNEYNDPNRVSLPQEILDEIDNAKIKDDLDLIYKKYIESVEHKNVFISMLTSKKQQL